MPPIRIIQPLALLFLLPLLCSCRTYLACGDLQLASRNYNEMIRWNLADAAVPAQVAEGVRDAYRQRLEAARQARVTDCRVRNLECDPDKGEAKVLLEIDYYLPPSTRVRTLQDTQQWRLGADGDKNGWRIGTLLPDFNALDINGGKQ